MPFLYLNLGIKYQEKIKFTKIRGKWPCTFRFYWTSQNFRSRACLTFEMYCAQCFFFLTTSWTKIIDFLCFFVPQTGKIIKILDFPMTCFASHLMVFQSISKFPKDLESLRSELLINRQKSRNLEQPIFKYQSNVQ